MKANPPKAFNQPTGLDRVINRRWIATLVMTLALALMLGTSGFQTYWSKERRLIAATDEIVVALKAYSNTSPGTAKEFPLEFTDLMRDPRMLADKSLFTGTARRPDHATASNGAWSETKIIK